MVNIRGSPIASFHGGVVIASEACGVAKEGVYCIQLLL